VSEPSFHELAYLGDACAVQRADALGVSSASLSRESNRGLTPSAERYAHQPTTQLPFPLSHLPCCCSASFYGEGLLDSDDLTLEVDNP